MVAWTEEENMTLRELYPTADHNTILQTLPTRNWSAIVMQAMREELSRTYQFNNSGLHRAVSVEDAAFMEQVGIPHDASDPLKRIWWITSKESNTSYSGLPRDS